MELDWSNKQLEWEGTGGIRCVTRKWMLGKLLCNLGFVFKVEGRLVGLERSRPRPGKLSIRQNRLWV